VIWKILFLITPIFLLPAYVFWRVATVATVPRRISRRWFIAIVVALLVLVHVGIIFSGSSSLLYHWIACLFLIFISLLAVDFVTAFGFFLQRIVQKLRLFALAAGLMLCAVAHIQGFRPPVVVEHEIVLKGLPSELDGTVLAAVADTHIGHDNGLDWLEERVQQILGMQPDMIVLMGDIVARNGSQNYRTKLAGILNRMEAPLGVWLVRGNHESKSSIETFEKAGIRMLRDESVEISPGFVLAGIDYAKWESNESHDSLYVIAFAKTLESRSEGATVLLCHEPVRADLAEEAGVELMLSGHTHGGQVWPFGYLVRMMYKYLAGRYEVEDMTLLVSRGTGTWGPRMRLWRRGEILRITLRCG
jgi:uncharacterized protein